MSQDLLKVKLHNNVFQCLVYRFRLDLLWWRALWANTDLVPVVFQFPSLCNQYYKLITFICEIFPEKIPQLPEDLFKSLMFSLELGMTSYPPTARVCVHLSDQTVSLLKSLILARLKLEKSI